jgi:hypothetical protein
VVGAPVLRWPPFILQASSIALHAREPRPARQLTNWGVANEKGMEWERRTVTQRANRGRQWRRDAAEGDGSLSESIESLPRCWAGGRPLQRSFCFHARKPRWGKGDPSAHAVPDRNHIASHRHSARHHTLHSSARTAPTTLLAAIAVFSVAARCVYAGAIGLLRPIRKRQYACNNPWLACFQALIIFRWPPITAFVMSLPSPSRLSGKQVDRRQCKKWVFPQSFHTRLRN